MSFQMHCASTASHILERFDFKGIIEELAGPKVHSLTNILTLDASVHQSFNALKVWFEEDTVRLRLFTPDILHLRALFVIFQDSDTPNRYEIMSTEPFVFTGRISQSNPFLTLTSTDSRLTLPNPAYLRIHAACCKVAHLSGAVGHYDLLDDGSDDGGYSERGANPHVLCARLYEVLTERSGAVELG